MDINKIYDTIEAKLHNPNKKAIFAVWMQHSLNL